MMDKVRRDRGMWWGGVGASCLSWGVVGQNRRSITQAHFPHHPGQARGPRRSSPPPPVPTQRMPILA